MDPEALYDQYLESCVNGDAEDPARFCARHGIDDAVVKARMHALHQHVLKNRERPPSPGPVFERLGEFRILRRLASGGMGTVFLAEQESVGRRVALKVIRPELSDSVTAGKRFEREAAAIGRLRHPNIVEVYAAGEEQGVCYIAMELLEGRSLEEVLHADGVPATAKLTRWAADLARALHHAHRRGIVHRDIKPSNIFIEPDGRPRVLDFGIAHDLDAAGPTLTRTFAGSPLYAAPEQIMGTKVDGRVDVYALGSVLYRALAGRVPFEGGSLEQVVHRVLQDDPLPPRRLNPGVPRDLETVILKAIEKEPRRRYGDAAALADDLEAILDGRPIRARPPGALARAVRWGRRHPVVAVAAAMLLAGVVGATVYVRGERRAAARAALTEAAGLLRDYGDERALVRGLDEGVEAIRRNLLDYNPPSVLDELDRKEARADAARREREAAFYRVQELLNRAYRLDPDLSGIHEIYAALYLERWRESRLRRDDAGAAFFAGLVRRHDREGRFTREIDGVLAWTVFSEPPGAELSIYRYRLRSEVVPGGGPRYVPVPFQDADPAVPYGTVCLRVERGAGEVAAGDHILTVAGHPVARTLLVDEARPPVARLDRLVSVDGQDVPSPFEEQQRAHDVDLVFDRRGKTIRVRAPSLRACGVTLMAPAQCAARGEVAAQVLHEGRVRTLVLPRGLVVRPTAAPLLASSAALAGRTPVTVDLPRGKHLFVLRKEGFEDARVAREITPARDPGTRVRLAPEGTTPAGFVRVVANTEDAPAFWIMERELTCGEYLEFLRDPDVRARIDGAPGPALFPRSATNQSKGGFWGYRAGEPVVLPPPYRPHWPLYGVSFHDAEAYAAWRTERARRAGRPDRYSLPTLSDWESAVFGAGEWRYTHGNTFRATWVKSCFSHPRAFPEPGLRYPVDESPGRVYDVTGGVGEWIDDWFDETRGLKRLVMGSWVFAKPERFLAYGEGAEPWVSDTYTGLRLVLRRPR